MNEYDLLDVIGDINDKYIENAGTEGKLDDLASKEIRAIQIRERRKKGIFLALCIMIVIPGIMLVIGKHWLLLRKTGNVNKGYETKGTYADTPTPTPIHYSKDKYLSVPPDNMPEWEIYQFMLWEDREYIVSIENCNRIGNELGVARARNEEIESNKTMFKDIIIYEFVGIDPTIAVIAYYPEEQEYYVYYNIYN